MYVAPNEGRSITIGSFGITFKVLSESVSGSVGVVEHTLAPGFIGAALHRHQHEDEISYVLDGELTAQIGNAILTAKPGTYVVKPRGIFHTF